PNLASALRDPPGHLRVPKPAPPEGPRRVGIQAGHWLTAQVPPELWSIEHATGASWNGVTEWRVNLDIAQRVAVLLRARGFAVDLLPTTVPPGYLADAFLALHMDSDGVGVRSGYKLAHGSRRGPYEDALVRAVSEEYARATGLNDDPLRITRNMRGYYPFGWTRFVHSVAPHTPAAILEMGYLSSDHDRALVLGQPDLVAGAIANGLVRFLDEVPQAKIFGDDLLVAAPRFPRTSPP
ncbi:MAG: N-acetylmuramoyl-L-alanine amidase, partial [Candidatus Limnocylindria bacterium]